MRVGRRISVAALNTNIDADLNLTSGHKISCSLVELLYDVAHCNIHRGNDTDKLAVGGGLQGDYSARITLHGKSEATNPGNIFLQVPNASGAGILNVLTLYGKTNTPYVGANSWRIAALAQATTDMDAVPQTKMWGTWTPTLTWATATPTGLTSSYRYMQIGKTVFYNFFVQATDSNATTGLTFTLPSTPNVLTVGDGVEASGTGYAVLTALMGYADTDGSWHTYNFVTGIDNQGIIVRASGFYEVA